MKYFKTKNSRRKGVAIELAMMLFLAVTAVTIMIVNTTMIQVEKQKQSYNDIKEVVGEMEEMQLHQIGKYFASCVIKEYAVNGVNESLYIPSTDSLAGYMSLAFSGENATGKSLKYNYTVTGGSFVKEDDDYLVTYSLHVLERVEEEPIGEAGEEQGYNKFDLTITFRVKVVAEKYTASVEKCQFG